MTHRFSFLSAGLLAAGLLASPVSAQERVALEADRALVAPVSSFGGSVLRNYDPAAEQVLRVSGNGGFVHGTNGYDDRGKVQCFDAPAAPVQIQSVTLYMVKGEGAAGFLYDLVLRQGAPGLDGAPGAGPGAIIYSQDFDTGGLTATALPGQPVEHVLTTPQTVSTSFCVGVEWEGGWPNNELGLISQTLPDGSDPAPFDWEQWDNGTWHNINQAWTNLRSVMWVDVNILGGSSTDADPAAAASVRLAPNPASDASSIEFTMTSAQAVAVEVFNVLGQRVASVAPTALAAGTQRIVLPLTGLAAGTYVVRVTGDEFSATRRVTVAH